MISMRMKKFYKKTGRKLQFDAKELVGFDKTKVECYNCHKTRHFARECRIKGNQDNWVEETKDGSELDRRDSKALVTIDGEGVDWTNHSEDEDYALMACNSSDSDTESNPVINLHPSKLNMSGSQDEIPPPPPPLPSSSQTPTQQTPHTDAIKSRFGGNDESKKMQKYILKQQFKGLSVSNTEGLHKGYDSNTNDVSTAYSVSNTSGQNPQYKQTSSYSLLANQSSCPQLDHEDLEQLDEYDLEEMDLKWQVAMISMRMKKFYKKTGRKLQFDAKEPVGFDKTKVECYNCHKTGHFARECRIKRNQDNKRRDAWNSRNKDVSKTGKKEDSKALVTINGEGVDWTNHSEEDEDYALMACNSSDSDTEREQLSDASIEIKAYSQGLKKVEAQLDYPHRALKNKGIVDSGCSRHMTGNKAYLAEFQDFNGGPVAFGGSKGYITGKGKIKTGKLDFEDVCFVKELQHFNLFSVSQMCDKKNKVLFTDSECLVLSPEFKLPDENQVLLKIPRQNNMYSFNLENIVPSGGLACLIAKATTDESNKWHRRLGHVNFKNLNKLVKGNLVRGLPSKIFQNDHTCVACQKGKQHKASCKAKSVSSISHSLQLLHMDLFGPTSVRSLNHKTYCLVITDDFSRFSWVFFLRTKDETSGILKDFIRQIENQLNQKVKTIRCDNGTEFKNKDVIEFCGSKGIKREYSNARTPQQNGVAERKNRTLIEAARTMLADSFLPNTFWAEAVSTACYVLNRVLVTKPHNKTPYELLTGKIPIISYIRPFGCHVTILNTIDHLGKFAGKSDEGFLVGYSLQSKAFRVYNLETKRVEENLHITFLENKPNVAGKGPTWLFDLDYLTDSMNYHPVRSENQANIHAGQQEANHNAGTEDIIDAEDSEKEDESAQDCFVLPIWSSYSSTITPDLKTDEKREGPREEEQVFLDELEILKRQEKDANEAAEALKKEFAQETENLIIQAGAAKASSTNIFSTVNTPTKASITKIVNTVSTPVSTASPHAGLSLSDPTNPAQDDSEIPSLEDIYQNSSDGIFTNSSYDDEGAVADFTNLEIVVNVSPIPTSRINSFHPSALILGDPNSAVQTRSKVNKSSGAHAFVSYVQKQRRNNHKDFQHCLFTCFLSQNEPKKISEALEDESWVDVMEEELLQFKIQKVWILVDLPYGKKAIGTKIEAIRIFLAFASYMGFIVYQMDVKSAFLYGKIDEEMSFNEILKKFDFANVRLAESTPIETQKPLVKDEEASVVEFCACSRFQVTPKSSHLSAVKRIFRHLDAKKKFVMYPRFISIFLDKQLANVPVPLDHFPVNALTSKDEGAPSERPSEAQPTPSPAHTSEVPFEPQTDSSPAHISEVPIEPQTDPSPRPSPSTIIPDSIPESSGGNLGGHSSSDKSLSGNEGEMTLQSQVSREKEKGVELKDIEETDRPRPTSTRSLLTLKPLPKIDPKDKGNNTIEEEYESEVNLMVFMKLRRSLNNLKVMKRWLGKYKKSGKARNEADRTSAKNFKKKKESNSQ
ncbi:putative ribonuclease H-like domain-containing protein [Tanacetum coccineum]